MSVHQSVPDRASLGCRLIAGVTRWLYRLPQNSLNDVLAYGAFPDLTRQSVETGHPDDGERLVIYQCRGSQPGSDCNVSVGDRIGDV
eukprot:737184-Rhodomonas_salina.3